MFNSVCLSPTTVCLHFISLHETRKLLDFSVCTCLWWWHSSTQHASLNIEIGYIDCTAVNIVLAVLFFKLQLLLADISSVAFKYKKTLSAWKLVVLLYRCSSDVLSVAHSDKHPIRQITWFFSSLQSWPFNLIFVCHSPSRPQCHICECASEFMWVIELQILLVQSSFSIFWLS